MTEDSLELEVERSRANLWECESWIPPFVEIEGRNQLDYSRVDGTIDSKAWAMYWAGKAEAYEHAQKIVEGEDN